MESLWRENEAHDGDLDDFKFSTTEPLTPRTKMKHWTQRYWTMDARSGTWGQQQQQQQQQPQSQPTATTPPVGDTLNLVEATSQNAAAWETWEERQKLLTSTSVPIEGNLSEDRLSILLTSPVYLTGFKKIQDGPTALRYTSLRRERFLSLIQTLNVHPLYLSLLQEGSATALKLTSTTSSRPCETYILRTSNALSSQSAICITHFPRTATLGAKTNAFITGYSETTLKTFTTTLTTLLKTLSSPLSSPTPLLIAFLQVEKTMRFSAVRSGVRSMQSVIHQLAHEQTGDPSARRKLNKTVDLYFEVQDLRTDGLVAWKDQLRMLRDNTCKTCTTTTTSNEPLKLCIYLDQLVARYDHRIGRCDMVLQGAGLAYQMETTQLSRKDTEIAIGDGKTMKAIAVLTMVFLPGTFIATMLAVPQIEDALKDHEDSFGEDKWLWYIVLAVPITVLALLVYVGWEYLYKRRYLKSLFGKGGDEKEDENEKDLEAGRASVSS